jgi:DNA-binding NarL/FixJ family response regulator
MCHLLFHGVRGFVSYEKVEEEICAAVDAVVRGHIWFSSQVLERYVMLSSARDKRIMRSRGHLSARETEIAGLLQHRLSDKEIGSTLGITTRTVRFHLQNIFGKLAVHDRQAVADFMKSSTPAERERMSLYATAS